MRAINIAYTLICDECGYVMAARQIKKHAQVAYWECLTSICTNNGKVFAQELEKIELSEVENADL